jgi:hypothetical protein
MKHRLEPYQLIPWFLIACAVAVGLNTFPQAIGFIQRRWQEDTQGIPSDRPPITNPPAN